MKADQKSFVHVSVSLEGNLKFPKYIVAYLQSASAASDGLTSPVPLTHSSEYGMNCTVCLLNQI
jgi:hypothetical protein